MTFKFVPALVVATVVAAANPFEAIAEVVNSKQATWTAKANSRFESFEEVSTVCGGMGPEKDRPYVYATKEEEDQARKHLLRTLPSDFDSRTQWPDCTVISHVRDQGLCGSCWAHAATEVTESGLCITTKKDIYLSTEDTTGCCTPTVCGGSNACVAGRSSSALRWIIGGMGPDGGIVTGGDYPLDPEGTGNLGCLPYSLPPCSVNNDTAHYKRCVPPSPANVITCASKCSNPDYNTTSFADDKHGANNHGVVTSLAYRETPNVHMMGFIVEHGPIAASFEVMADFPAYSSGIYHHVTGGALGGHAIAIVGFGSDNGTDYWTVKNSWNDEWGMNGYFRILRGVDECGIEMGDVAGVAFTA